MLASSSGRAGPPAVLFGAPAIRFGALALAMALVASIVRGLPLDLYGWIPLAAALVTLLIWRRPGLRQWPKVFAANRAGLPAWLPAVAIPALVLTSGYVVAALLGFVRLDLKGESPILVLGLIFVYLVAGSVEAIGEEFGWRGFLLPLLIPRGRVFAGFASGLLWATWHVPLIYVAAAYHPGAGPVYFAAFAATITAMSFIANELRAASGSVWPAVIFHGAHNAIWAVLETLVVGSSATLGRIGGESGIVPLALYWVVALAIVFGRPGWPAGPVGGQMAARPSTADGSADEPT